MATLPLDELPGVGWTLRDKLHQNGLYNCADLQSISRVGVSAQIFSWTEIKPCTWNEHPSFYDVASHVSRADSEIDELCRWLCNRLTGKRPVLCSGRSLKVSMTGKCNLLRYRRSDPF
jgi:hypothetical protein